MTSSRASQASALGDLEEQYIQACTGTPMNYNALTHELRVDHTHPEKRVLTTAITLKRFNDEYVPLRIGASTGGGDDDPAAVLYDHENGK